MGRPTPISTLYDVIQQQSQPLIRQQQSQEAYNAECFGNSTVYFSKNNQIANTKDLSAHILEGLEIQIDHYFSSNIHSMSTSQTFCHSGSAENYFNSPKMPVKDHIVGLRSTKSSFKHCQPLIDHNAQKVLGDHHIKSEQLSQIDKMKEMKLMHAKELHIVNHNSGKENSNIGSHHDRQTNAGYSRNKLGGFYTS